MLYREIIAVCSQIHTKHIGVNTLCGQNVELLNFKRGGTYSYHWAFKVNNFAACALTSCDISHTIRYAAPFPVTTVSQSLQ